MKIESLLVHTKERKRYHSDPPDLVYVEGKGFVRRSGKPVDEPKQFFGFFDPPRGVVKEKQNQAILDCIQRNVDAGTLSENWREVLQAATLAKSLHFDSAVMVGLLSPKKFEEIFMLNQKHFTDDINKVHGIPFDVMARRDTPIHINTRCGHTPS